VSFMDRARERAYASGFAGPSADARLAELEREVAALRGAVGDLQGELRGANEWIAEHSGWINVAKSSESGPFTLSDVVNAVMVATGGRASEAVTNSTDGVGCPDAACQAAMADDVTAATEWKSPEWLKDEQRSWE
jgi:hypothetical protein